MLCVISAIKKTERNGKKSKTTTSNSAKLGRQLPIGLPDTISNIIWRIIKLVQHILGVAQFVRMSNIVTPAFFLRNLNLLFKISMVFYHEKCLTVEKNLAWHNFVVSYWRNIIWRFRKYGGFCNAK